MELPGVGETVRSHSPPLKGRGRGGVWTLALALPLASRNFLIGAGPCQSDNPLGSVCYADHLWQKFALTGNRAGTGPAPTSGRCQFIDDVRPSAEREGALKGGGAGKSCETPLFLLYSTFPSFSLFSSFSSFSFFFQSPALILTEPYL